METVAGEIDILVFEVAGRRFAMPVGQVRELLRAVSIAPVAPGTGSEGLEGWLDLRGRVVPVLDLRQWLGLPAREVEPSDHLIVAQALGRLVALRVDRAIEMVRYHPDAELTEDPGRRWEPDPREASLGGSRERVIRLPGGLGLAPLLDLRELIGSSLVLGESAP